MRPLKFLAALAAATLLHVLLARLLPPAAQAVDLFLVVVVLNALPGNSLGGMLGGFGAGLVQDGLSGGIFGLQSFAGTILGYAVARVAQRLVVQRALGVGLAVAGAAILQRLVLLVLTLLVLPEPIVADPLRLLVRAVVSGAVGALAFAISRRWERGVRARNLRRGRRLRLE